MWRQFYKPQEAFKIIIQAEKCYVYFVQKKFVISCEDTIKKIKTRKFLEILQEQKCFKKTSEWNLLQQLYILIENDILYKFS